jgi:beta-galactosidase
LKFSADIPFEAGVNKYSPLQLFQAFHPCELTAGETTYLTLDLIQRGLGSGSCGPQTLPQYEISEKDYRFEFFFEVIG